MPTYHALVAEARRRLQDAGIPPAEAELDARLMLERLTGWDAAHYFARGDQPATPDISARFAAAVDRRVGREPVAYITGTQEFWGMTFVVTPDVLIPRPETEAIVEIVLALTRGEPMARRVADVGTGSGCIAIAIAAERPSLRVTAGDVSSAALAVAAQNVRRHGLESRVELVQADLLTTIAGPFDLIVSNPPYVPETSRAGLQPEVVDHEPHHALFAGADGLDVIRALVDQAATRLHAGGTLVFEFGFGQADAVADLIAAHSTFALVELRDDLQGIPRTAVARRRAG